MARKDVVLEIFGRLLPADFRERVFEPAMTDLRLDEAGREATPRGRWLARFVIIAECLRLGLPQFVWRRGRPTPLGGALLATILVVLLLVQRHNYARAAGTVSQERPMTAHRR